MHVDNRQKIQLTSKHDEERLAVSAALIRLNSLLLVTALRHRGYFADIYDMLPVIGRALDQLRFETPAMQEWMDEQRTHATVEDSNTKIATMARNGDIAGLESFARELESRYPVPVIVGVDGKEYTPSDVARRSGQYL